MSRRGSAKGSVESVRRQAKVEHLARAEKIILALRKATADMQQPAVTQIINEHGKDPFFVLVSCLLSLRTKDIVSLPISQKLFQIIKTPQQLLALQREVLEEIIYSTGFFRQKARTLQKVSGKLIDTFGGRVPATEVDLLSLPGVGRKTANLVLGEVFGIPAICVDIHVHRIANRLGLVETKTPEQTEKQLQKILPKKYWIEINRLLVVWGQNICTPVSPFCSRCVLGKVC